jgi:hypothetical protein
MGRKEHIKATKSQLVAFEVDKIKHNFKGAVSSRCINRETIRIMFW